MSCRLGWLGRERRRKGEMILECPCVLLLFGAFSIFFSDISEMFVLSLNNREENSQLTLKKNEILQYHILILAHK